MPTDAGLDLNVVDAEHPGSACALQVEGTVITLVSAVDLPWSDVLVAGHDPLAWVATAVPAEHREQMLHLPIWKLELGLHTWRTRHGLCLTSGDDQRLAAIVRHYGRAIECDLAPGIDLVTEWQSRRWRKLLNLIDGLPRASAYVEAISQDDALAEAIFDDQQRPPKRRMTEWSPEVELLSVIADRQAELAQILAVQRGAKPGQIVPQPRPSGAADRIRKKRREAKHNRLKAALMPHAVG